MIPMHCFRVCSENESAAIQKGEIACIIGRDVQIDPGALENYCFQLLSEQVYEVALLAGVIAFVDRVVRRRYSDGWARSIAIIMPVRQPDRWKQCSLPLQELLQFLTGDHWQITFIGRRASWSKTRQDIFPLGGGKFVVVPYSNGLDSFAQSQLLKLGGNRLTPIRITAWNRGLSGGRDWKTDADGTRYRRISIPIRVSTTGHPEPTYRTRSFLFNTFAGIAAHLAQAESVVVPENGQGSLGPSLVSFGAESPQRGSHPAFTRKLGRFLEVVLGAPVKFEHPQLWKTKGEVLQLLKKEKLLDGWAATTSCPRDRRDVNLNKKTAHCGVCAGCLLRRSAAFVNDLAEPENTYLWRNLRAPTLAGAIHPDSDRKTRTNDLDIANHGVLAMTNLAKCANSSDDNPVVSQSAFEISGGESIAMSTANLRRLVNVHKDEWTQFRNHFGPKAWINSSFTFV